MNDFLILLFVACLFCVGLNILTRQGYIFGVWQSAVRADDGQLRFVLANPLSECLVCMSSLYGAAFYGLWFGYSDELSFVFGICLILIIGLSVVEMISEKENQEIQFFSKIVYLFSILLFCATQYQTKFIESIVFMVCLAGANCIVDRVLSSLTIDIQANQETIENSVDQAEAVERIIEALKNKD